MALSAGLHLRQGQSLALTPQLLQAIKLLQLPILELAHHIETELERNPLLERLDAPKGEADFIAGGDLTGGNNFSGDDFSSNDFSSEAGSHDFTHEDFASSDFAPSDVVHPTERAAHNDTTEDVDWAHAPHLEAPLTSTADLQDDYGNAAAAPEPQSAGLEGLSQEASPLWSEAGSAGGSFESRDDHSDFAAPEGDLYQHLHAQIAMKTWPEPIKRLVDLLVEALAPTGYLEEPLTAIAARLGLGAPILEKALALLQTLDPAGIGARDLAECLRLQLIAQNRYDPLIAKLLNHLPLLAARDLPALRKACGADLEDLHEMIAEIRKLNPKPGLQFTSLHVQTAIPDVIISARQDGSWHVALNEAALPRVLANRQFYARLNRAEDAATKIYIEEAWANATWLIRSLEQRARTLLKVSSEILRQQDAFFAEGFSALKPLTLKMVAEATELHESTISRVVAGKIIATPRGSFDLKFFFTNAVASAEGQSALSSEAVRFKIKKLIEGEGVKNVLSDDALAVLLGKEGINVARRTVAKYRESLGIASSAQRRRMLKMG